MKRAVLFCTGRGSYTDAALGEFLNREDSLKLLSLLKGKVRVGNHSPRSRQDF